MSFINTTVPEVHFEKTALTTVVCQLRFNQVLRIAREAPAELQEELRELFPVVERQDGVELVFLTGQSSPLLERPPISTTWRFKTEDERWIAALGSTFLSLETTDYRSFMDFQQRFSEFKRAVEAHYRVGEYTRVGLRYINQFDLKEYNLPYTELFNPLIIGPASDPSIAPHVGNFSSIYVFGFEDTTLTLRCGIEDGGAFLVDMDHATDLKTDPATIDTKLKIFNDRIYQVFRWTITDRLYQELRPEGL